MSLIVIQPNMVTIILLMLILNILLYQNLINMYLIRVYFKNFFGLVNRVVLFCNTRSNDSRSNYA